tara:strand:- start:483 stop:1148 length:666 start_codon:yes stop_codon:yes gene_type:complete
VRRLSIRGGEFSLVGDNQQEVLSSDNINVIIVNAAPVSRSYFGNQFDPNKSTAPKCWSSDTQVPSPQVPQENIQARRCMDCTQNVRGSGSNGGRACRFQQRLAVVFEGDLEEVYQLQIPASTIFGRVVDGNMGMQAYAKHLSTHGTSVIAVITNIYFDKDSVVPKLYFKPMRPIDVKTGIKVSEMVTHEDTKKAITSVVAVSSEPVSPFASVEGGFDINAN